VWHSIFTTGFHLGERVVRAAAVYLFLIAALRVLGKREIGQANTLDFLVLLLVANAVQNGIIGADNTVTGAFVGAATLFGMNRAFSYLAFRYQWAERLFEGDPTYLIQDHRVIEPNLRKQEISILDLRSAARRQGFASLDQVGVAVLETNGVISMFRGDERPVVAADSMARRPSERRTMERRSFA
jgi:uncharacterized membrane protein YcaP (DUF421 family)